jgi:hypothetical protein
MNTHRITTLDLDEGRLEADLNRARRFHFSDAYSEFICGSWRSCMLWNRSGDADDTFLKDSDQPARATACGKQMPYVAEVLARTFRLEHLRYARLATLAPDSVLLPHRDFLELRHELARVHIPLVTDSECYSAEERTVYQMRRGEVWFMDATKTHTAAAFSRKERVHLILDFTEVERIDTVLRQPVSGPRGIPPENLVARKPLEPGEQEAFFALARVIDLVNYRDVLALLIKKYFTTDLDAAVVYDWLADIARRSGNRAVAARVEDYREMCLVQR